MAANAIPAVVVAVFTSSALNARRKFKIPHAVSERGVFHGIPDISQPPFIYIPESMMINGSFIALQVRNSAVQQSHAGTDISVVTYKRVTLLDEPAIPVFSQYGLSVHDIMTIVFKKTHQAFPDVRYSAVHIRHTDPRIGINVFCSELQAYDAAIQAFIP
jgi:hypothetical protein